MVDVPANENFDGSFAWPLPQFEELYNDVMDASFTMGTTRKITLHLTPIRTEASGITNANKPAIRFNPILGRAPRNAPFQISTTRQPAVRHTPRDVVYTAHIRHGPKEISDKDAIGRLAENQVATTLIGTAISHVMEAESVTIDGIRYKLHGGPRPIGFRDKRYIIVIWESIPEKEQPNG